MRCGEIATCHAALALQCDCQHLFAGPAALLSQSGPLRPGVSNDLSFCAVGVTFVKDAVAEWKRQRGELFVPLTYRPGDLARSTSSKCRFTWTGRAARRGSF